MIWIKVGSDGVSGLAWQATPLGVEPFERMDQAPSVRASSMEVVGTASSRPAPEIRP